ATFEQFWPLYVRAHRNPVCRALHYVGTSLGLMLGLYAIIDLNWLALLAAPIAGYGIAWIGHFAFEKNRPATFGNFWWSLRGDFRMLGLALRGRMRQESARLA